MFKIPHEGAPAGISVSFLASSVEVEPGMLGVLQDASTRHVFSLMHKRSARETASSVRFHGAHIPSADQCPVKPCRPCLQRSWVGAVSVLLMILALRYTGTVVRVSVS